MIVFSGETSSIDRAISSSLHQLEDRDWIKREIETSVRMPFLTYRAIHTDLAIHQAAGLTHSEPSSGKLQA